MDESDDTHRKIPTPAVSDQGDRVPCDVGNCLYTGISAQAVGMHKYHVHGIRATEKRQHKKKQVATNPNIGGEDIVLVVLAQLFPAGIPVNKLRPVLDWAAQTENFVDKLRG